MTVRRMTISRVEESDPRYPEPEAFLRPDGSPKLLGDLYLLQIETAKGQFECPLFTNPICSYANMAAMLRMWAVAVESMDKE